MTDSVPLGQLHDLLLPADLQIELCITGITEARDGKVLRFRLDPGRAYARCGWINSAGSSYLIGITQRYLPGDKPEEITGTYGVTLNQVPDEIRSASARAYDLAASRPHWLAACPRTFPEWHQTTPGTTAADTLRTAETAAQQAKQSGRVIYVSDADKGFACTSNPPSAEVFLSVTPQGLWSQHNGSHTYPIEGTPNASVFFSIQRRGDIPEVRFPGRPARTGGDGARLSAVDLRQIRPEPAARRGPTGPSPEPPSPAP
jgi:hypothetical protein